MDANLDIEKIVKKVLQEMTDKKQPASSQASKAIPKK
jgi:hypothetical protein